MLTIPAVGQLAIVRKRPLVVSEIVPAAPGLGADATGPVHPIKLSSVADDGLGEALQVIWELEPGTAVHEKSTLPDPDSFDPPKRLPAFLDAERWGAVSQAGLGHGFHETKQGIRYTISQPARREVLDRLLALNQQRYAEEVAAGLHDKNLAKSAGTRQRGAASEPPPMDDLLASLAPGNPRPPAPRGLADPGLPASPPGLARQRHHTHRHRPSRGALDRHNPGTPDRRRGGAPRRAPRRPLPLGRRDRMIRNVSHIEPLDGSPLVVNELNRPAVRMKEHLEPVPTLDEESQQYLRVADVALGPRAFALTREHPFDEVQAQLAMLWQEYARAPGSELDAEARLLKAALLARMEDTHAEG
jgi:hypothetical protein